MTSLSRRHFLKSSAIAAGALAFPAILPARLFGQNAPSKKINVAFIGCGNRALGMLPVFAAQPDVEIVGVCDPKPWILKKFLAATHKTRHRPKTYASYKDVLADASVDAIVCATMDHWHVPIGIAAARAGKHMYMEKPLAVSVDRMPILRKAVQDSGVIFQYGTFQRSGTKFRRAIELVRNGYIGNLKTVYAFCADFKSQEKGALAISDDEKEPIPAGFDYDMWTGPSKMEPYSQRRVYNCAWHIYNYSIGWLSGWGAHPLDIAQAGMGMDETGPVSAEGVGEIANVSMFDTIWGWDVNCRYANGVDLRFLSGPRLEAHPIPEIMGPGHTDTTYFLGDEGWVNVGRWGIEYSSPKLANLKLKNSDWRLYGPEVQHIRNFFDCVKTGDAPISPLEPAIRNDTISHLCNAAIRLGTRVEWDPVAEKTKNPKHYEVMVRRDLRPQWDVV